MSEQDRRPADRADSAGEWPPCQQGELAGMVRRTQRRRRAQKVARMTSMAALVLAAAVAWQFQPFSGGKHWPGGISCEKVLQHQRDFQAGDLDGEALADRIREHLAGCPHCAQKFQEDRKHPGESPQAGRPRGPSGQLAEQRVPDTGLLGAETGLLW